MEKRYSYNNFCSVWSSSDKIIINFETEMQLVVDNNTEILSHLMAMNDRPLAYLMSHFSEMRIMEILHKKIIVPTPELSDERLSRQSGFLSLIHSQPDSVSKKIREATILVLGAGAIGTHVAWSLAALGVREIHIVDSDVVEASNLNRQLLYTPEDIGKKKVDAFAVKLRNFNPDVTVIPYDRHISSRRDIEALTVGMSLVIKAIDSPESVVDWVNSVCVAHNVPYIAAGFVDSLGVVGPVYLGKQTDCLDCYNRPDFHRVFFGKPGPTCAPMTMTVASRVAILSMKLLSGECFEKPFGYEIFDYKKNSFIKNSPPYVRKCKTCGLVHEDQHIALMRSYDWAREVVYLYVLVESFILTRMDFGLMLMLIWIDVGFFYFVNDKNRQSARIENTVRRFSVLIMGAVIVSSVVLIFTWWHALPNTPLEVMYRLNGMSHYIMIIAILYCVVVAGSYWVYRVFDQIWNGRIFFKHLGGAKNV